VQDFSDRVFVQNEQIGLQAWRAGSGIFALRVLSFLLQ
jgi:hypothetical protein